MQLILAIYPILLGEYDDVDVPENIVLFVVLKGRLYNAHRAGYGQKGISTVDYK